MPRSILALLAQLFGGRPPAIPMTGATESKDSEPAAQAAQVQTVIGKVSALTSAVAQDVGRHNDSVQAISDELRSVAENNPGAVAAIVCKLLVANQELQGRLERAENTLSAHSRQLQDAVISSRTDGLTGLTNRRALDEELRRCLVELQGQGRPAALLMLDVDHFKRFNDTYGHVAGDQALVHVAEVLRAQARASDIVARFGGEEFAVVFTAATAAAIRERAERLRLAISGKGIVCEGREVRISASAGLAEAHSDDAACDWIKRADAALYAAKDAGRDCGFVAAEGGVEPLDKAQNEADDHGAAESANTRVVSEAAAELAAEAFADTSFVQNIAKRIAEWRRGGATLTVILAELAPVDDRNDEDISNEPRPVRLALPWARGCVREMDLVTRWKSSGLAILLPCTTAADAKSVARRLRSALALQSHGEVQTLSLNLGIAEGIEGNDAKRVLERAWLALEAAKLPGSGGMCVHDGVRTVCVKRVAVARP